MNFQCTLPTPSYRQVKDYKQANTDNIQKAISVSDWQKVFKNENTNETTRTLTGTFTKFLRL